MLRSSRGIASFQTFQLFQSFQGQRRFNVQGSTPTSVPDVPIVQSLAPAWRRAGRSVQVVTGLSRFIVQCPKPHRGSECLLDQRETELPAGFNEMLIVRKAMAAAESVHDDQTTAIHDSPDLVSILPEKF